MDATNGLGTDVEVLLNQNDRNIEFLTKNKKGMVSYEAMPMHLILGHEMIHGLRSMKGEAIDKEKISNYIFEDVDEKTYMVSGVPTDELITTGIIDNYKYTENKLRKEQELNQRIKY